MQQIPYQFIAFTIISLFFFGFAVYLLIKGYTKGDLLEDSPKLDEHEVKSYHDESEPGWSLKVKSLRNDPYPYDNYR